jgi:hypothetical protein
MEEIVRGFESKLLLVQNASESALLKANDNEQYSRKYNLRFVGIEEKTGENCVALIVTFCNEKLGVAVKVKDINRAHRIGTKNAGKPRAIIVKFKDYNSKMAVCKQRNDLKGSKFYINEDLTKINMKLFYVGRNNVSQIRSIWPSDGKLLARGHGRTGRKKLGGQKEICPTFRIVPDHFRKFFFRNKLISAPPPPPQCTILGVKKIFPEL